MSGGIHEECGIFALSLPRRCDIAPLTYYGLYALQHRGQEGAGIAVCDDGVISIHKDAGLVSDVFDSDVLSKLPQGTMALGHVRYGTTGNNPRLNVQPLVINHLKGRMALDHNGNLTNDYELREELELKGSIFHTTSDTEVIAYTVTKHRLAEKALEDAVIRAMDDLKGAYSLVVMSSQKLIAARDPWGFRPLCLGSFEGGYVISSETCALDAIGAKFIRDILPGEVITISNGELKSDTSHCNKERKHLCVFELIYFARPDSVIDGVSVQLARQRAGALPDNLRENRNMKLHASGEDYLEAILVLQRQKGMVRSVDVARHLEVSKPSVSHAVTTLKEGGFLTMDDDFFLHLTDLGREVAEQTYEKHRFFMDLLTEAGVDPASAERDACRMEHVISQKSFEHLRDAYNSHKED